MTTTVATTGTTYLALTPNGTPFIKTSANKTYAHAVWVELGPDHSGAASDHEAFTDVHVGDQRIVSWHTTLTAAAVRARKFDGDTDYARCGIIDVTAAPTTGDGHGERR